MTRNSRPVFMIAGLVALLSGLAACHGGTPSNTGYVPSAGSPLSGALPAGRASSPITASCKTPMKVGIQKDKSCHFKELGYKGTFDIVDQLNGIAAVRPKQGDDKTPFIVRGITPGNGTFDVKDSQGNVLHVSVVVPDATIKSTCGHKIDIHLLGVVSCQFSEFGYDGTFTIDASHLSGLASVSPDHGTKQTVFTVTGLIEGGGYFIVQGARKIRVHVQVTTL
ncbi:MAG TPA: hypothetical protein VIJ77_11365 [Candidatus Tumulicola sp.]